MVMKEEIAAIRERAERATPGPWEYDRLTYAIGQSMPGYIVAKSMLRHPDAEFIAHARTDVPRLLDALEAAQEREAKLVEALQFYADQSKYPPLSSDMREDGGQRARDTLKELEYGED